MKKPSLFILIMLCLFSCNLHASDEKAQGGAQITDLLAAYAKNSGLKVVASKEVKGEAIHFGFSQQDLDFDLLLTILKLNGYTAFKNDKYVEVVPNHRARIYANERVKDGVDYPADQYLVDIIKVNNLCTSSLMPILMPLVFRHSFIFPQHESNSVVIVDYFSNIKMIKALVKDLDTKSEKQKNCEKFEMRPRGPIKEKTKN